MAIRPYGFVDHDDAVKMVRHDHKFTQINFTPDQSGFQPFFLCNYPKFIQCHDPIHNFSEEMLPLVRANGDEICAGLGIIIFPQPDGTPVVDIGGFMVGRVHGC